MAKRINKDQAIARARALFKGAITIQTGSFVNIESKNIAIKTWFDYVRAWLKAYKK